MFEALSHATHDDAVPPAIAPAARRTDEAGAAIARICLAELAQLLDTPLDVERHVADTGFAVRRLAAGETLYRAGDTFDAIYVVRSGFCKTVAVDASGSEMVLNFPMGGDVLGLDGIDEGRYAADVVAIELCSVVVVPFARLARLGREHAGVDRLLYTAFSRELVRQRKMMKLLNTLPAEARLATFLLELSERYGQLGYSRTTFALRMKRVEIGSYLGIKLETVSRMFSAFAAAGILTVERKQIRLEDVDALREIAAAAGASRQS